MQQKYLRMEMRRSRRGYPWRRPRPEARGARDALIPSGRIKGSFAPRFTADSPWECAPNTQPPGFTDRQLSRNGGSGSGSAAAANSKCRIRCGSIGLIESSGEEIAGEEISRRKQAGAGAKYKGGERRGEEREASRAPGSGAGLAFPCGAD